MQVNQLQDSRYQSMDVLVPENGYEEMHGWLGDPLWEPPRKVVHCDLEARPGYITKQAHEYEDTPHVMQQKILLLAQLVRRSEKCLVYTGAGISTSSGINDYATRGQHTQMNIPRLRSPLEAQPTYAHRSLAAMYRAGMIHQWVQQNHDGLPQKAGFPQHIINEIHGAWYDPSNPVVPMSGSLRSDLFSSMIEWENHADLCLSMGTSMCGMNADRVFTTVANKGKAGSSIGGVIVNSQQTQFDSLSCLRIFGKIDTVMKLLMDELDLTTQPMTESYRPDVAREKIKQDDVFIIPYNRNGHRISTDSSFLRPWNQKQSGTSHLTLLDLREGSVVRLVSGPYEGDTGEVLGKNREGHYRIQFSHVVKASKTPRPFERLLGSWWVEAAVKGTVDSIPVVNISK